MQYIKGGVRLADEPIDWDDFRKFQAEERAKEAARRGTEWWWVRHVDGGELEVAEIITLDGKPWTIATAGSEHDVLSDYELVELVPYPKGNF